MFTFLWNRFYLITSLTLLLLAGALAGCGANLEPESNEDTVAVSSTDPALRMAQSEHEGELAIWVDEVSGLYALDMEIQFDPAKLQVIDADPNTEGTQIQPGQAPAPDFVVTNTADNQRGIIHYVVTQIAPRPGFDGNGLVATINWQGDLDEETGISFGPVMLVNEDGQPILDF